MIIASLTLGGNNADTGYWINPDNCCFDISWFINFTTAIDQE
tara:strand:+ start:71 stop:196 length:126 start_codon:yes stop_codon:yes gene_type:complete